MKTKPHHATPQSAAALARLEIGATGVIVVKVKRKTDFTYGHPFNGEDGSCGIVFTKHEHWTGTAMGELIESPYKPGDVVAVKEKHKRSSMKVDAGIARAIEYVDGFKVPVSYSDIARWNPWQWRSSTQMPAFAVRTHLRVKSVACKQLQEVTEEECRLYGATHDGWNTERQVFQSQLKAAWSNNEWHWFITAEKCNNAKGAT